LVQIADTTDEFVLAIERALNADEEQAEWLRRVDVFLSQNSWDRTWARMSQLIEDAVDNRLTAAAAQAVK